MKTAMQQSVGVLASSAVETYLSKAEKYEKPVISDRDPEDLHQMRVNLRRLRTVMQVFASTITLPKSGQEAQVAKVSRCLGSLRDLDVITASLEDQYAPDLPDQERQTLKRVFKYLAKQRKKAYKQVKSQLKGDRYKTLKNRLHQWALMPNCNETARLDIDMVLPDVTMPLVSRLWLHPGWLIGVHETKGTLKPDTRLSTAKIDTLVSEDAKTLHSFRKQVKRVRYQLKFLSDFYGDRLNADLDRLAELQDIMGNLQDSSVMVAFLAKAMPDWEQAMPTLKSLLAARRHRAWKQWQTHQRYYLDPKHRESLRQILLTPGAAAPSKSSKTKAKSSTTAQKTNSSTRKTSTTQKSSRATSKKSASADAAAAKSTNQSADTELPPDK